MSKLPHTPPVEATQDIGATGAAAAGAHRSDGVTVLDVELRAAFRCSKAAARHDGIGWELTFDEFYDWWTQEDRWDRRGRTAGRISMARLDGTGPFALNNIVEIERCRENSISAPMRRAESEAGDTGSRRCHDDPDVAAAAPNGPTGQPD